MGLDMYLSAQKYISAHEHSAHKPLANAIINMIGSDRDREAIFEHRTPSLNIEVTIGYWRKANQIHNWFVQSVQDGVDKCQESYVAREDLEGLEDVCSRVLQAQDEAVAMELLPPTEGFFFGDTSINEYYYQDLRDTIAICDRALSMDPEWSFSYRSSW